MPRPHRQLADLRSSEIAAAIGPDSVLVQPVGAVEQHGPHLPFSTDLVIAQEIAERTVAARGEELDLWLLPPLAYSKSDEHAWSPGTVWLSATTLLALLDDIGRSLATLPAKRLAFVNGHGGNSQLLAVANRELHLRHGLLTFLLHPRVPRDSGGGGNDAFGAELGMGVHAGAEETSVMAYLRPDLVNMNLAARNVPETLASNQHVRFGGTVPFGWSSDDFGPSGVIGDPTLASAEAGEQLVAGMVAGLGEALAEVATFTFPEA